MKIVIYRKTDVGSVRSVNEDNFIIISNFQNEMVPANPINPWKVLSKEEINNGIYLCVIDGMGGMGNGDVASETIASKIISIWNELKELTPSDLPRISLERANDFIQLVVSKNPQYHNMGAVATCCYIFNNKAYISHVGDTRLYLFRDSKLSQITEDQSLVAELVRAGRLTPEQAEVHPERHIVTQAIGPHKTIKTADYDLQVQAGDKLLLCSDGLSGLVRDSDIEKILTEKNGESCINTLIKKAKENGGDDNITLVIAELSA